MTQLLFNVVTGFWGVRREPFTYTVVQPTLPTDFSPEPVRQPAPAPAAGDYETIKLRWRAPLD